MSSLQNLDTSFLAIRELLDRISPQEGARLFASPTNPTGMFDRVELVTPERAGALLQEMPEGLQRSLRTKRVESYVRQRVRDKWRLHHQGIAIDVQGRLRDGQHRLQMVVASGLATPFKISYNVPDEGILHVDEQMTRSTRDSIRMSQMGSYSCSMIASTRAFLSLPHMSYISQGSFTREEILEGIEKWHEPLQWAEERLASVSMVTRSVRGLVARASLHVDRERLAQFCEILKTGMPISKDRNEDSAAIVYYRHLSENRHSNESVDRERYLKGQTAIQTFINRKPMTSLRVTEKDLYPLLVKLN